MVTPEEPALQPRAAAFPAMRKAFLMSVHPDQHAEYERRHRPIWAELEAILKGHGVSNYSIFLDEETSQLFGYAEIESEEKWAAIADTGECKRWWVFMRDIMPSNADNSPVSRELIEVFHLD
jgi:L-rhamnose mutarotase